MGFTTNSLMLGECELLNQGVQHNDTDILFRIIFDSVAQGARSLLLENNIWV